MELKSNYHMAYTKKDFFLALSDKSVLNERRIELLNAFAQFPGYRACGKEIGIIINAKASFVNLIFGQLSKAVCQYFKIERLTDSFNSTDWWPVLANGKKEKDGFYWTLKKPFVEALLELEIFSEELIYPDEAAIKELHFLEGGLKQIIVNAYERNIKARNECIKHYGTKCQVCNIDFEKNYGQIGKDFIHVHHIAMISERGGKKYSIDPINDLRPVCPNCHAMIHRKKEPLSIEELRLIITHRFES